MRKTLKTISLNCKLERLCKSHLPCITSSKDSKKLEKSLCVRDKAEYLCWMPVVRQTTLYHLSAWFCHWHYHMGPGILPETTVSKHNPPCHLQMPTKALSCKKEAICSNIVQKRSHVLWSKAYLKWTVSKRKSFLWSDESKFDILVGNHGRCILQPKKKGDIQAFYQRSVQKPASLMVWGA